MFKRLHDDGSRVVFYADGKPITAHAGDSVAAALLANSAEPLRSNPVSGSPRSPYCMIGYCFECLVEIDGKANCQACLVVVRDGMRVRRQHTAVEVKL